MVLERTYGKLKYILYEPSHLETLQNLPFIVVLHGSGEIGSSLSKLKKRDPYISLANKKFKPNAYVLMPQLPRGSWGKYADDLKKLIDYLVKNFKCDPTRISITGHSLGGMGVIEMLTKYPGYFSAGAPLSCAKNYKAEIQKISHIPLYFLYGEKERSYKTYAREMYAASFALNEESKIAAAKGYGHPIQFTWCSEKYGIFDWLMSYHAGELRAPTWNEWLYVNGYIYKLDDPIPDQYAKGLGAKKGRH